MENEDKYSLFISEGVFSGALPSDVFRRLLSEDQSLSKSNLGTLLIVAFPEVDSVVWNIVVKWKEKDNSKVQDTRMNISVIDQLLKANYSLVWSREWIEEQWKMIKPTILAGSHS